MDEEESKPASKICNPVPIGVAGFALTVFTLGLYTSGNFDSHGKVLVLTLAAFYGGLTQLIAGFFAAAKGRVFAATFMTSYGAFWISYVGLVMYVVPHAGPAAGQVVALFLIMWTVITLIFTVASLATNKLNLMVFITLSIAIILEDIAAGGGFPLAGVIGGYFEMLLGAIVWYVVMAEMINEMTGKETFPTFPFKNGPILGR